MLLLIRYQHLFLANLWNEFESHGGVDAVIWTVSTGKAAVWIIHRSSNKGLAEKEMRNEKKKKKKKKTKKKPSLCVMEGEQRLTYDWETLEAQTLRFLSSLLIGSELVLAWMWLILVMNCHSCSPLWVGFCGLAFSSLGRASVSGTEAYMVVMGWGCDRCLSCSVVVWPRPSVTWHWAPAGA